MSDTESVTSPCMQQPATRRRRRRASGAGGDEAGDSIVNPASRKYSYEERLYYRNLPKEERRAVADAEARALALTDRQVPRRFHIIQSLLNDDAARASALRKLELLNTLDTSGGEYAKLSQWMDRMCALPLGRYQGLPVSSSSSANEMREFILRTRRHLDEKIYGHKDAKGQIVRLLAQWLMKPDAKGLAIGIHGPKGVAKTSLVKDAICQVLGLPYAFIALGGMNDVADLVGHGYTYEGAMPGRISEVLTRSGCMNPVICFDELDKVSSRAGGEEVIHTLMHLTDASQNALFQDRYFAGDCTFDMSRCLLIFTYNDESLVNPILLDRMVRIQADGYSVADKVAIAKDFLLPRILADHSFRPSDLTFKDEVIRAVIERVNEEQGVRNLQRGLVDIVSHLNLERLMAAPPSSPQGSAYVVQEADVKKYVYRPKDAVGGCTSKSMMYT